MLKISIIIPTYKEGNYIKNTLETLKAGLTSSGLNYEIIVSDGGSRDKTVEIAKKYVDLVTMDPEPEKRSISRGKNLGAKVAKGEYLVFIDADVEIPFAGAFLEKCLRIFSSNRKLVAMTTKIRIRADEETLADKFFYWLLNSFYLISNNVFGRGIASGEFQMIKRDAFRRLNGYREDLVAGEDNDMFFRLSKIGEVRLEPSLVVYHSGRRIRKIGWPKLLYMWINNGLSVALLNRSAYKRWDTIR